MKDNFYLSPLNLFKIACAILGVIIFKIVQQHPLKVTHSI